MVFDVMIVWYGMGLMFISYDLLFVMLFCDCVVVMYVGCVVEICVVCDLCDVMYFYMCGLFVVNLLFVDLFDELLVLWCDLVWFEFVLLVVVRID